MLWLFCHETQNIIFIIYILKFQRTYPCFFLKLETCWFFKNSHTIYNKLLFRLYTSMNRVTSQFVITPFAPFSAHTLTRAYATSRSSPRHTDQHHTFYNRRGCSWFSYLVNTYDAFVSLWMVSVVNVSPLVDSVGHQMNLASLVKRIVWLYNQILRNFLYVIFPLHVSCNE
jgi:hypothetical protein